jgi:hypothetical protein
MWIGVCVGYRIYGPLRSAHAEIPNSARRILRAILCFQWIGVRVCSVVVHLSPGYPVTSFPQGRGANGKDACLS